ncbi:MAG: polymer-forming cytoskeletal protein [Acidobacteriota bacterium]
MLATKTALNVEPKRKPDAKSIPAQATAFGPRRIPHAVTSINEVPAAQAKPRDNTYSFQGRVPVITGEASYRGSMPVDGVISGHLGAVGSAMTVRQRTRNGSSVPELDGDISFKDMLRINGHVAGKVFSFKGTLIVDGSARVDASIDVAVAVIGGVVNGDVIGHQRVELGPSAVINGNISTRSIAMKPGAVFTGDCRMLKNETAE